MDRRQQVLNEMAAYIESAFFWKEARHQEQGASYWHNLEDDNIAEQKMIQAARRIKDSVNCLDRVQEI